MLESSTISFVIPCYNGSKHIVECIQSINNLILPNNLSAQVIVVDNNSSDDSVEIVRKNFSNVLVVSEKTQGRSPARNCGVAHAKSEIICFVDVDVTLDKAWMVEALEVMAKNPNWSIVSSNIILKAADDSWFEKWRVSGPVLDNYNSIGKINIFTPCLNTAACIFRKSLFLEVGGFDLSLNYFEDIDIARRIGIIGGPMLAAKSKAYCYSGMTLLSYLKRYFNIGKMASNFMYKWNDLGPLGSKIFTLNYYIRYLISRINFNCRLDYFLYKMLVHLMPVLGALVSLFTQFRIEKIKIDDDKYVKIIEHDKIIWLKLKSGNLKVLDTRRILNPYGRNYHRSEIS